MALAAGVESVEKGHHRLLVGNGDIGSFQPQSPNAQHGLANPRRRLGRDGQPHIPPIHLQPGKSCIVHDRADAVPHGPTDQADEFCARCEFLLIG